MERAMGIEPTSEAWEARNKKLETPDLAALSMSGPKPKDEPRKTRLYRNWRRRRPRGTRLTTGEGAMRTRKCRLEAPFNVRDVCIMHPQIGDPYEDGARRGQPRQRVFVVRLVDDLAARYNAVRMWWRHVIRAASPSPAAPGIPISTVSRRFFY